MISPTRSPKILTTPKITLPAILLLAKVITFAATFASPVSIVESPPVLPLAELLPLSAASMRSLPIVASLLWKVVLLLVTSTSEVLVESDPLLLFCASAKPPPQPMMQLAAKSRT